MRQLPRYWEGLSTSDGGEKLGGLQQAQPGTEKYNASYSKALEEGLVTNCPLNHTNDNIFGTILFVEVHINPTVLCTRPAKAKLRARLPRS